MNAQLARTSDPAPREPPLMEGIVQSTRMYSTVNETGTHTQTERTLSPNCKLIMNTTAAEAVVMNEPLQAKGTKYTHFMF